MTNKRNHLKLNKAFNIIAALRINRTVKINRICILGAVMVFTLALTGCESSSSSSNKKNYVKESKRTDKVTKTPV